MRMNAQTVGWFVFLALIKNFTCANTVPFQLEDRPLTAKEGSCIEIKCEVTYSVSDNDAYWFWMKDAKWIETHKHFNATIIYSTNNSTRPVSPEFAGRVQYVGSSSSSWGSIYTSSPKPLCSILICNLKKNDSGQYSFRFIELQGKKWVTQKNVTLTVTENPCLITFENPHAMKENDTITLTCSTLSSCSSSLRIEDLSKPASTQPDQYKPHKSTTVSFTADWQDDGRVFSCQVQNNQDKYLIRNISITVEYAPRDISARKSSENVKEGDDVTLTCFAKGRPNPTFTWFRNGRTMGFPDTMTSSEWKIPSITDTQSGEYHCEAKNEHGTIKSKPVTINVIYAPDVEIKMNPLYSVVRHGETVTLNCNVKRSNPQPTTYSWFKDGNAIGHGHTYVHVMKPEDKGSYTCQATNIVGSGTSEPLKIEVEYLPRKTHISTNQSEENVKVRSSLTFTCVTDAHPDPSKYSWYRYNYNKQIDSSLWTSRTTNENLLHLESVQRADEACYICNATNSMGTGDNSDQVCIKVLYPPTVPVLSMTTEVTENQTITITCTVESNPTSTLTLTSTSNAQSSGRVRVSFPAHSDNWLTPNNLRYTFNVTSDDAGFYTCSANNFEGSNESLKSKLVVKYTPKDVTIKPQPDAVVHENKSLTLHCTAKSYPQVDSFTWTKDGKEEFSPNWKTQNFTVKSVSPSDSGLYRCAARNYIGTGQSQAVEVKVKYAPKHTKIIKSTEQQDPDGRSYVTLSCSAQCYPSVEQYLWYKEEKGIKKPKQVHEGQHYTVYSDQPGVYYCVAKNEINKKQSDPVHLFDGTFMKLLMILLCLILILLVIVIISLVYRHRKNNSVQQGTTQPCFGFLGRSNGARSGHLIHETFLAEPSRSRDDLLPDRSYRPEAQRCQPAPDSTPASEISSVYCMVSLPPQKQAPTAQKPTRPQGGHTVDDSLNYASLQFGDNQNSKQLKAAEDVYAKVCRSKPHTKNEQEWLTDYENISTTLAANSPNPLDDDTDSSDDDDVQLNYTQVTFTANPGHQRASSDSTSSDEYEVQYSDVKI